MAIAKLENPPLIGGDKKDEIIQVAGSDYIVYVDFSPATRSEIEDAMDASVILARADEPSRPLEDVLKDVEQDD